MGKWERIRYFPCKPLGKNNSMLTECAEHIELARHICHEGIVLLKNENSTLPLHAKRIAVFGKASADYVAGGGGAGSVEAAYTSNLIAGFRRNNADIFEPLARFYEENVQSQYDNGCCSGHTLEPVIPQNLLKEAKDNCDVAIISICRKTWEALDVKPNREVNSYYLTEAEENMVSTVTQNFTDVILVLNIGTFIDPSFFVNNSSIAAVVLASQGGMEGGNAVADILCGKVNPSGKLTDTYAALNDYPSTAGYAADDRMVEYQEDIYVGYRYFDTIPNAAQKVCYPFGFGLSYTTFSVVCENVAAENDRIVLSVRVTNTGNVSGKEVVQVYSSYEGTFTEHPKKELRTFGKTKLLAPQESELLELLFPIKDLAYYDDTKAEYIIASGNYRILVGTSSVDTFEAFCYIQQEFSGIKKCKNRCVPIRPLSVLTAAGTQTLAKCKKANPKADYKAFPPVTQGTYDHILPDMRGVPLQQDAISLAQVWRGEAMLDDLMEQLTDEELITLLGGCPNAGIANTAGIGGLESHGIPTAMTADGPAGLRLRPELDEKTTAFPCATLLACSWNTELAERFGTAVAMEVKENNFGVFLAPALNIHRNPLNGRNFEYFSEDPLISGKMAAAVVKGVQKTGIAACVKHFACNNKENARVISDSVVSERALREIYLKGFEIAIRESEPAMVMTAYNLLNGTYTSENAELLNGILREEWKYEGLITTDWDNLAEPIREVLAGNNLRMPGGSNQRLQKALREGIITRDDLMKNARYVLQMLLSID